MSKNRFIEYLKQYHIEYLAYAYAILLPLPNNLKSVVLILLALVWLFSLKKGAAQDARILLRNRVVLSFLLLYSLYMLSVFYSDNKSTALDFLVLQISIPLLPFIFYRKLTKKQINNSLLLYTSSLFALSIFAIVKTYFVYFHAPQLNIEHLRVLDWAYFSFCLPISVSFHAPYFSLYMCAGLLIIWNKAFCAFEDKKYCETILLSLLSIYFLVFIAMLSSRTAFVSTIGITTAIVCVKLILRRKLVSTVAVMGITLGGLFVAGRYIPYLYSKLNSSAGLAERVRLWESACQIIISNPVFGVGTGDRKEALFAQYVKNNFHTGVAENLNVHNQFLDTGVAMGLPGLLAIGLAFLTVVHTAVVKRQTILLAFILIFTSCCITESLLHRQAGVVLFSFFCAITIFADKR